MNRMEVRICDDYYCDVSDSQEVVGNIHDGTSNAETSVPQGEDKRK